jgi:uridine kinase
MASPVDLPVARVLEIAWSRPPRIGGGRLVCIDGPAGSGKSTLAEALGAAVPATVVHLDDLLDGWEGGLPTVVEALVADVLRPLAAGSPAAYHRYDWHAGRFAEWVPVPPGDLLVVEGVASGSAAAAAYASALVWMEAPHDERLARGLARDGDAFAPHWSAWARREAEHFAREGTRARADVVVDTGTREPGPA